MRLGKLKTLKPFETHNKSNKEEETLSNNTQPRNIQQFQEERDTVKQHPMRSMESNK